MKKSIAAAAVAVSMSIGALGVTGVASAAKPPQTPGTSKKCRDGNTRPSLTSSARKPPRGECVP